MLTVQFRTISLFVRHRVNKAVNAYHPLVQRLKVLKVVSEGCNHQLCSHSSPPPRLHLLTVTQLVEAKSEMNN